MMIMNSLKSVKMVMKLKTELTTLIQSMKSFFILIWLVNLMMKLGNLKWPNLNTFSEEKQRKWILVWHISKGLMKWSWDQFSSTTMKQMQSRERMNSWNYSRRMEENGSKFILVNNQFKKRIRINFWWKEAEDKVYWNILAQSHKRVLWKITNSRLQDKGALANK